MREIRLYGSEGGGAAALPTPIRVAVPLQKLSDLQILAGGGMTYRALDDPLSGAPLKTWSPCATLVFWNVTL